MASSQIQIQSDSTEETEPVVADPAQNNTTTATIDNVFTASAKGDFEKLRKLVEQDGASLSSRDNDGNYALHEAVENNHIEIVQYIIKHGGDINVVNNIQQTALHCAAVGGWILVADVLLQNGALVEAADVNGHRAVHYAAANGKTSFLNHIVTMYNADFDVQDNAGRSPLHLAAEKNFPEMVQHIIEHGGDVNVVNNCQQTALHYAAAEGWILVADVLLQKGALVESVDEDGNRAVHHAAAYGKTSFLNHIITIYNADLDVQDNDGRRPLHLAAAKNFSEMVQHIIKHGGDVNAIDNNKNTSLHYAAVGGHTSVADVVLQIGAQVEAANANGLRAVHFAAQNGQTSFLNHMVAKYNVDIDVLDKNGWRPLHFAARNNHPQILQYIIEHGGDVNAVNNSHQTALHLVAVGGSISVADILLHNGAHVEAVDVYGKRAVHVAAGCGKTSFLNHIVDKHNADFDVPDNNGDSPLHYAAEKGRVDTVTWLLSKNASQKRQDKNGRTPLHVAALNGCIDTCMVLMDAGTEQEMMMKDNEGNTAIQLSPILTSKALYEECKNSRSFYLRDIPEGTNRVLIIAMQGDAYTGKSYLAHCLALKIKCPIISLDSILDATEPTGKRDTLISNSFNIIIEIVKSQISLGLSVIVDSSLSRFSHLQKLTHLAYARDVNLQIIECKPKNEYVYQLEFEKRGSKIYSGTWYKPAGVWPLPKVPRDYTDDDIPFGVSKLVYDTNHYYEPCGLLKAMFDVASCGHGHKTKYRLDWEFIHQDKMEQFTCPCPVCKRDCAGEIFELHVFKLHEAGYAVDDSETLCGVCDFQVEGSCYTCMDCPLTLHKPCAELARGGEKHFLPKTFPTFMSRGQKLRYDFPVERPCAECRKDGKDFSCKCKYCLFESHLKSRLVPTVVQHMVHDNLLTFSFNLDDGDSITNYICLACRKLGHSAAYVTCTDAIYHPQCALLPPSVQHSHGGYTHDLEMITRRVEKEEDYLCDCCLYKMDPSTWYYYCSECNIQLHMECALFLDFDTGKPNQDGLFMHFVLDNLEQDLCF